MPRQPSTLKGAWLTLANAAELVEGPRGPQSHPTAGVFALARALLTTPRTLRRWADGSCKPAGPAILAVRNLAERLGVASPL